MQFEPEAVERWEFYLGGGKTQEPDGSYVDWQDYEKLLILYRALKDGEPR